MILRDICASSALLTAALGACGGHVNVSCGTGTHLENGMCYPTDGGANGSQGGDAASAADGSTIDAANDTGGSNNDGLNPAPDASSGFDSGVGLDAANTDAGTSTDDGSGDDASSMDDAGVDASEDANDDTSVPVSCDDVNGCTWATPLDGGVYNGSINYCLGEFHGITVTGDQSQWFELTFLQDCSSPGGFGVGITLGSSSSAVFDLEVYGLLSDSTPGQCPALTGTYPAQLLSDGYYASTKITSSFTPPYLSGSVFLHVVAESGAQCASGQPWTLYVEPLD